MKNTCTYLLVRSYTCTDRPRPVLVCYLKSPLAEQRYAILFAELTGLDPSLVYDSDVCLWSKLICRAARVLCGRGVALNSLTEAVGNEFLAFALEGCE